MREWLKANGGPPAIVIIGLAIGGFKSHNAGLALIGIGVVLFFVVQIARPLRWLRERSEPVPAPPRELASPEHREQVRALLRRIRQGLEAERPVEFGDDISRRVMTAHYPALVGQVNAWNVVAHERKDAPQRLREKFKGQLRALRLVDPDRYDTAGLAQGLGNLTAWRAMNAQLDISLERQQLWEAWQPAESWQPEDIPSSGVELKGTHEVVISMKGVPAEDYVAKANALIDPVEQLFWDAQNWDEAHDVRRAEEALVTSDRDEIYREIDKLAAPDRIAVAKGCPVCGEVA